MFLISGLLSFPLEISGCVGASCCYHGDGLGPCSGHELEDGKAVSLANECVARGLGLGVLLQAVVAV